METAFNAKMMGMDQAGGGGGGFLEIDSDQQIYGDTFGAVPANPFSGMGLPTLGGSSGNTLILLIVAGLVLAFILTRKKK